MLKNQLKLIFLLAIGLFSASVLFAQSNYTVRLLQETFTPTENLTAFFDNKNAFQSDLTAGNYHVLIQFKVIPDQTRLQQIKAQGILLDTYLPNLAYLASIPAGVSQAFLESVEVRAVMHIKPIWKKALDVDNLPTHAVPMSGYADLNVKYFKNTEVDALIAALAVLNTEIRYVAADFHTLKIRLPQANIAALAALPSIKWLEAQEPMMEINNERSRANHRSNVLAANYAGARNLKGNGVVVGVWDTNLYPHTDFGTRAVGHQYLYAGNSEDHANHVVGTIAGAGWLDPNAHGMAPEATIHAWNCCTNTPDPIYATMRNAATTYGVTITSNSYGYGADCVNPPTYWSANENLDQLTYDVPNIMHVFSAGNSQNDCTNPYYTVSWTHKNSLIVAATNQNSAITNFSSFGPLFDGRICPTISGVGSSVYSTVWDNGYDFKSGTSMSCPGVSGTIAQIYERYKQLYNGNNPDAALIKALVCNTADDQGNVGPDYVYGFGQINALRAVEALENHDWLIDSIAQGGQKTVNIAVPAGAAQVRVLLDWTDLPGSGSAAISLVNDLDLYLTNGIDTIYPWILDPSNPSNPATKGEDHINNIVQITVDTPPAGNYTIVIEGQTITNGNQRYALAYQTIMPEVVVTYPIGGEALATGSVETIRWTATGATSNFLVQYSVNDGQSWQFLANLPSATRTLGWSIPNVFTNKALIRVTNGNLVGQSDTTFTVGRIPEFTLDVDPNSPLCGEQARLLWDAVPNATEYEIFEIDSLGVHSIAVTTDTFHFVTNLETGVPYWFAMRALNNADGLKGRRSVAKKIELVPAYDLGINKVVSPNSACALGVEDMVLEVQNYGCRTFQTGETVPFSIDANGTITQHTITLANELAVGNILSVTIPNLDFSTPATAYNLLITNELSTDTANANDVLARQIVHQPTYTTIPFIESFEANNGFWSDRWIHPVGSSWEWGIPNGSIINTASNGSKVWTTGLNSEYVAYEFSYLYSPCFDFSALTDNPHVVFDVNHDLGASIDRSRMQYSLNGGANWSSLGAYFLKQSNGWETRQEELNNAAGNANVQFRLSFVADGNEELGNGMALDKFQIIQNPSSSTISLEEAFSMTVYPNPSRNGFNLILENTPAAPVLMTMTDAFGKTVYTNAVKAANGQKMWRITTDNLAQGVYFLSVKIDGAQVTRKVLVW